MTENTARYPWPPPYLEDWCASVDMDEGPAWLIEPLIPSDSVVVMSGPAKKSNKTWFAFQCVAAIASGRQFGPIIPAIDEPQKCLILEAEGGRRETRRRWTWLANTAGFPVPCKQVLFAHRYPLRLNQTNWVQRVQQVVADENIKLVIIDTLAKAFRGDENSAADAGAIMEAVDILRGAGATIMYLHHLRKSSPAGTDIDEELRGSSALAGFYDVHLAFREHAQGLHLTVRSRDEIEREFMVRWDISEEKGRAKLSLEPYVPNPRPVQSKPKAGKPPVERTAREMFEQAKARRTGAL